MCEENCSVMMENQHKRHISIAFTQTFTVFQHIPIKLPERHTLNLKVWGLCKGREERDYRLTGIIFDIQVPLHDIYSREERVNRLCGLRQERKEFNARKSLC